MDSVKISCGLSRGMSLKIETNFGSLLKKNND